MAERWSGNMAGRQLIVPRCPLKDTPYPVCIELARSIDAVNNKNGHGWMQLAHYFGCSANDIRSIEARADHDSRNSNSPTLILFSDLQTRYDVVLTMRDMEQALLELNLEAVRILHKEKNLQLLDRAYHAFSEGCHSIDTNTEPSICNCYACINLNMSRESTVRNFHTPRIYESRQFVHETERKPPVGHHSTPRTYVLHPSLSGTTATSRNTITPLETPQQRGGFGIGPFTASPNMELQEQTNLLNPFNRQMSCSGQFHGIRCECLNTFSGRISHVPNLQYTQNIPGNDESGYTQGQSGYTQGQSGYMQGQSGYTQGQSGYTQGQTGYTQGQSGNTQGQRGYTQGQSGYTQGQSFHGTRTMQQDLNSQDVVISPDDNCQISDEEGICTCETFSSELHYSDFPGHNEDHQQTSQHSENSCCLLSDETFVKHSYDQEEVDYSQCTCSSPTNIQNNELRLSVNISLSNPDLENLQNKEKHRMENKRNSMDVKKTDSFSDGKENGNCNRSMNPSQRGPGFSVFVTYSRHSREHVKEVIELCTKLKEYGIRVRVDLSGDQAKDLFKNKHDWLDENLKRARFVIVCISPTYSEDVDHPCSDSEPIPDISRLDVRFIFDYLRTEYHGNCSRNKRVIPVIFENSGANRNHVPNFMRTTIVYNYPQKVDSIIAFLQSNSPEKLKSK